MRKFIYICIILLLGASAVFLLKKKDMEADRQTMPTGRQAIRLGNQELSVEVADTLAKQVRGLSGHQPLKENEGMLFVYENPRVLSFWMRGMNFAIDIIWIDGNGIATGIMANVSPDTFPQTFSSVSPAQYVLEVPAEWAERHGVAAGDQLTL